MTLYGKLFQAYAESTSLEKAVEVHGKIYGPAGEAWAKALKEKLKGKEIPIKIFSEVYRSLSTIGVENEYEAVPNSFKVIGHDCPVYNGLRAAGLDHDTIGLMCIEAGNQIIGEFKKSFPNVEASFRFRNYPEGTCLEEYTIK